MFSPLALALFFLSLDYVLSEKDANSYISSAVSDSMYWRDAPNVLQDLSRFDKLYARYHNCA